MEALRLGGSGRPECAEGRGKREGRGKWDGRGKRDGRGKWDDMEQKAAHSAGGWQPDACENRKKSRNGNKRYSYIAALILAVTVLAGCGKTEGPGGNRDSRAGEGVGDAAFPGDSGSGISPGESAEGSGESGQGVLAQTGGHIPRLWEIHRPEELIDMDFLLYRVNCGSPGTGAGVAPEAEPDSGEQEAGPEADFGRREIGPEADSGEQEAGPEPDSIQMEGDSVTGLYHTAADQAYGADSFTGKQWGYQPRDYMEAQEDVKAEGLKAWRWGIREGTEYDEQETGFYYDFELPAGEYEVTLGFSNPFSPRTVTVDMEGSTVVEDKKILKYKVNEVTANQEVTDGILNIKVYNPDRGKSAMNDPVLSHIEIRAVPEYDETLLALYLERFGDKEVGEGVYTRATYEVYIEALEAARKLQISGEPGAPGEVKTVEGAEEAEASGEAGTPEGAKRQEASQAPTAAEGRSEDYRQVCEALKAACGKLEEIMIYTSFQNGRPWTDDEGNLIQAHGGQVQRLPITDPATGEIQGEKWWWVGEDKTAGAHGGICAYSSEDLYNWHFEGLVMRNVKSREELETDSYFQELYGGLSGEELNHIYECLSAETAIIERPKLIFNEKTKQYVLWFHADGPTAESSSSYAAASAGVAVSDTPNGPFRFIDRYRLNTCPEDQEDFHPQSKGMARDMNLFVDDDGTAYIIYSSEENLTLYISKLNDAYTYLAAEPEEAVYGRDFIRLFPGAQREAPALFKREGGYYLVTSGCTGWAPNQARYYRADSVLGEWKDCGDPCVGDAKRTTFDSQSTCVFAVNPDTAEPEKELYIYMGDRWNSEDLPNSRYIWLPMAFDEEGGLTLGWQDEWSYGQWGG